MAERLGTYDDINNVKVRSWNRCAMWFRAGAAGGMKSATEYLDKLDDIGRQQTIAMLEDIRDRGYATVRSEVVRTV